MYFLLYGVFHSDRDFGFSRVIVGRTYGISLLIAFFERVPTGQNRGVLSASRMSYLLRCSLGGVFYTTLNPIYTHHIFIYYNFYVFYTTLVWIWIWFHLFIFLIFFIFWRFFHFEAKIGPFLKVAKNSVFRCFGPFWALFIFSCFFDFFMFFLFFIFFYFL